MRDLKGMVSSRRQYAGFMVGTIVAISLRDSTCMTVALVVHVVLWAMVIYALTVDIRAGRDADE